MYKLYKYNIYLLLLLFLVSISFSYSYETSYFNAKKVYFIQTSTVKCPAEIDLIILKGQEEGAITSLIIGGVTITDLPKIEQENRIFYKDIKLDISNIGVQLLDIRVNGVMISNHTVECIDPIGDLVFLNKDPTFIKPLSKTSVYLMSPNITHSLGQTTFFSESLRGPYDITLTQDPLFNQILKVTFEIAYTVQRKIDSDIQFSISWGSTAARVFKYFSLLEYYSNAEKMVTTIFPYTIPSDRGDYFRPTLIGEINLSNYPHLAYSLQSDSISYKLRTNQTSLNFLVLPKQRLGTSKFYFYNGTGTVYSKSFSISSAKVNSLYMGVRGLIPTPDKIYPILNMTVLFYEVDMPFDSKYLSSISISFYEIPQFVHPLYGLMFVKDNQHFRWCFPKRIPPFFPVGRSQANYTINFMTDKTNIFSYLPNPNNDALLPIVKSISIQNLNNGKGQAIISLIISDNYSGFSYINYNQLFKITSLDLISGNLNSGVYQKIIYISDLFPSKFTIADQSGNSFLFEDIYNIYADKIDNSFNKLFNAFDISLFYFENKNIDVTNFGYWNTLYLNFTTAGPDTTIFFVCNVFPEPVNYRDYPFYYNQTLQLYEIKFYLPAKLANNSYLDYSIWVSSYEINNQAVEANVGDNATLAVFNTMESDQTPPLIDYVHILTSTPLSYDPNDIVSRVYGWMVTISDESGLESANFTVKSQLDLVGYNFTFTPNDRMSGDMYSGTYLLPIYFSPSNCTATHIFSITYVSLRDVNGRLSQLNAKVNSNQELVIINPLFRYLNEDLVFTLNCTNFPTLNVMDPAFSSFSVSRDIVTNYSTRNRDRSFLISSNFSIPDGYLEKNKPLLMLETFIGRELQFYECENLHVAYYQSNLVGFNFHCSPPYGFGFPNHIIASIFGVYSKLYKTNGKEAAEIIYISFDAAEISLDSGTIDSNNYVFLYGRNFMIDNTSTVSLNITIQNGLTLPDFVPTKFDIFNPLILSFAVPSLIQSNFKIRVISSSKGVSQEITIIHPSAIEPSSSSSLLDSSSSSTSTTPSQCPGNPVCGGKEKGNCELKRCVCIPPYTGYDCNSIIVPIDFHPNTTQPSTNITVDIPTSDGGKNDIKLSSLIQLTSLLELDVNSNVVQRYEFKEWLYTNISNTLPQYFYQTKIPNDQQTELNVTITFFEKLSFVYFAQQNLTMNPNTLKYQVSISKYPFQSSLNSLQLVMFTNFTRESDQYQCTLVEFSDKSGEGQDEYLEMKINDNSFNGRFIKRALVDNRVTTITNSLLDSNYNLKNSDKSATSFIGINIPNYQNEVVMDPDFSLVISFNSAKDKEGSICSPKSSKLSKAQLAGIIVGCVAFTAIIVTVLTYFIYKKRLNNKQMKSLEIKLERIQ